MHRQIETKKAEKIQANLHMIDLARQNDRILFVSNYDLIRSQKAATEDVEPFFNPVNPKLEQ